MIDGALSVNAWEAPALPKRKRLSGSNERGFAGARVSPYVVWTRALEAEHERIKNDLVSLRSHARQLKSDNAYVARYESLVEECVIGSEGDGITFESTLASKSGKPKQAQNDVVESEWAEFGKAVTTDGTMSWLQFRHKVEATRAIDGEVLIRLVRGYPNRWGFAVELIDADRLDHLVNTPQDVMGNRTVMGVKMDRWNRPIGYWIRVAHPADWEASNTRSTLVDASEIIHYFDPSRICAWRGISDLTPVMVPLSMLDRLDTSVLAAANFESDRLAIIKAPTPVKIEDEESGEIEYHAPDTIKAANELQRQQGAGWALNYQAIPLGTEIEFPAKSSPNPALQEWRVSMLKKSSTGLGVSYAALSSDQSQASYSAQRSAEKYERDGWRRRQQLSIRKIDQPIFAAWAEMAVLSGAINLPIPVAAIIKAAQWTPRSWSYTDPSKDIAASVLAIRSGLSTWQIELGKLGLNWRKVFTQAALERKFLAMLKLSFDLSSNGALSLESLLAASDEPKKGEDGEASTTEDGNA